MERSELAALAFGVLPRLKGTDDDRRYGQRSIALLQAPRFFQRRPARA
jgi:hypothetical protein